MDGATDLPAPPADTASKTASELMARGAFDLARLLLEARLAQDPADLHVLLDLARCAAALGDHAASLRHHETLARLQPDSVWAAADVASDLLALGEPARATEAYGRARAIEPDNLQVLFGLGRCARALGDHRASLAHHEAARASHPGTVWPAVECGADLLALGETGAARDAFEAALLIEPGHVQALFGLARCARAAGDLHASLAHHEAALAAHPNDNPWAHVEIGVDRLALGDAQGARRAFDAALAIDAGNPRALDGRARSDAATPQGDAATPQDEAAALLARAHAARAAGDLEACRAHLEAAHALAPGDVWLGIDLASTRLALGDTDAARDAYEHALVLDPANAQALFGLARCARAGGDRRASLALYEAALSVEPEGNVWAHVEIGADLLALGELDAARDAYAQAHAIDPANVQALFGLGQAARARGDHRASLAFFEAADRLSDDNHWAAIEIGLDRLALGEAAAARAAYDRALALAPENPQALLGRARCAAAEGDIEAAASLGARACAADPGNAWSRIEVAGHLRALGRNDEADAHCQAAASLAPDRAEPLLGLALTARLRGDRPAALAFAQAAHALDPDAAAPLVEMATELTALDRTDEAQAALETARRHHPAHAETLIGLAGLARRRADRQTALALLREARAADPGNGRLRLELAAELRTLGLLDEARALVEPVLEADPTDFWLRLELGAIERAAADLQAARTHYLRAAEDHPHRAAHALVEAATVERELGRVEQAGALLERAAELDPGNATMLVRRGEQALACRDAEAALGFFRAAHAHYPSEPGAGLAAVEALIDLGRIDEAEAALDEFELRYPAAQATIRRLRVTLLRRVGAWPRARAAAVRAATDAPDDFQVGCERYQLERLVGEDADAVRALAIIPARSRAEIAQVMRLEADWAEEHGETRTAREALLRAESLDPQSPDIQWDLCRLAMHALDLERARQHLRLYAERTAGWARARGGAPHPSQSHYGQILDELLLDDAAVSYLRPAANWPAEERMARALDCMRDNPDSTATALFALVAAREIEGAIGRREPEALAQSSPIPNRLAQYWNDPEPPADIARFMGEWRDAAPGWTHAPLHDAGARAFLAIHHGTAAVRAFDRAPEPAQKADLLRLALLGVHGGLWLDADDRPLARAAHLFDGASTLVCYQEDFGTLGNNMLAAIPAHPVITRAFEAALAALLRGDRDVVWLSTGPGLISRALVGWLADAGGDWRETLDGVTVLRRRELFRCMAMHCHAGYKRIARHWSNSTFARARRHAGAQPRPDPNPAS